VPQTDGIMHICISLIPVVYTVKNRRLSTPYISFSGLSAENQLLDD
jgi:hypothetical protein